MKSWNDISLKTFQEVDAINSDTTLDDFDKVVLSACIMFNCTPIDFEKKQAQYSKRIAKIFNGKFNTEVFERIGRYKINYDCGDMRFGQYMEANYYLSQSQVKNAEKIMASIAYDRTSMGWVNDSADHAGKSEFFLHQPVTKIMGCLKKFVERFAEFNKSYSWLFGLDKETHGEQAQGDKFNKIYGWWYAAESIAAYKRITLDEVYGLNVRDAFSSLAYLKAKSKYESEQLKRTSNGR